MASENRGTKDNLIKDILDNSCDYSFFQALYVLEMLHPEAVPSGHSGPFGEEIIKLRPNLSFGFPASDIYEIKELSLSGKSSPVYRVTTNFLGLYGTDSPLPSYYTEELLEAPEEGNPCKNFLDMINHRLLSFFYRSWKKYRYHVQFKNEGKDRFSSRIFSLVGLEEKNRKQIDIPPNSLLRFSSLFFQQPKSAEGLIRLLSTYFRDVAVEINQCVGQFVKIQKEQINRLGRKNTSLSTDITLGTKVYSRAGKFRIRLFFTEYGSYLNFLPDTRNFKALVTLTRLFVTDMLDFDIELSLKKDDVPLLSFNASAPKRLGLNSWLKQVTERNVSVVFSPMAKNG